MPSRLTTAHRWGRRDSPHLRRWVCAGWRVQGRPWIYQILGRGALVPVVVGRCAAAGARLFTQIARPLSGLGRHKGATGCLAITAVVPVATRRLKQVPDIDALHT
jgi:hypothetical protein